MVGHFGANRLLEAVTFFEGQTVCFGNDGYDIDYVCQLLHDNHVDGLETVTGWADKVEAAVDARVFNVTIAHCSQLFAQVLRVLVLDVLDNGIPFPFIVNLVAVAWRVDDAQIELDVVFLNAWGVVYTGQPLLPVRAQDTEGPERVLNPTGSPSLTMLDHLNLRRLPDRLIDFLSALGVEQMRCEYRVYEGTLAESRLALGTSSGRQTWIS